ncbi:MAG: ATP-dependent helicase [Nitrososphaerota archaeon]|nr:ATP-dependent helicase [Nitrososphaerota archaeon]
MEGRSLDFTKDQAEAISAPLGNLQLIACAGSGKTEVVAQRVAYLMSHPVLEGRPLLPRNIVAFTFTDKAAAELKDRIGLRCREVLGDVVGLAEMFVGTIHAFCLDLLMTEAPPFLKYDVLNEVQQRLFIDRESKRSGLTTTTDLTGISLRRYVDTSRYTTALSVLREGDLNEKVLQGASIVEGLAKYREALSAKRYLDYTSILEEAVTALRGNERLRKHLSERVRCVIVDEYQDVNPVQERVVRLLHNLGAKISVVGDDDQTIYQWRGSNLQNIVNFATRYPSVTQIQLQENHRSSEAVIHLAREFIAQNRERLPKEMVPTGAQSYEDGDIVARTFPDPDQEAQFITTTINQLRGIAFRDAPSSRPRGLSYSDMAILLRSVANNGHPITEALKRAGIPFIVEGMSDLFQTPEADAARQLFYFLASRDGVDEDRVRASWEAAELGVDSKDLNKAISEASVARSAIISGEEKRFSVYNLQRTFIQFLEDIRLTEERIHGDAGVAGTRAEVALYNLGMFSQLISDFEEVHFQSDPKRKYQEFSGFLQFQAESYYPEGWQGNQYANPDAVRILTVHGVKGMQFPVVFVPALIDHRFPSQRWGGKNVWHIVPRAAVRDQARYEGSIEDERRLFYVAVTRSKKFLFLTWAPVPDPNKPGSLHRLFQRASEFWDYSLGSSFVKRRSVDFTKRPRLPPEPRSGIENVTLTFSELKYYFECPYEFKLRILYGFNPPIYEGLGYGKSLHNALADLHARVLNKEKVGPELVPELVDTHLHLPYAYPKLKETLTLAATRVLKKYLKDNDKELENVVYSEKQVEIHLSGGVTVQGRIDLVRRLDTNETSIVDLKSSDRTQAESVTEAQLHIYALGYRELTGENADKVEIYELEQGKRKPRAVDEFFIGEVKKQVATAANSLRQNDFPYSPSARTCSQCDFVRMCSAGEPYRKG